MIATAACRGAATIVNAIATGKGAAFGIGLETDAIVELERAVGGITLDGIEGGEALVSGCVTAVARMAGLKHVAGRVTTRSEIPTSKGLKSSSAASNAVALATSRALGIEPSDTDLILAGVEESLRAGVTVTGAYDDACACFLGGVVLTNNSSFSLLKRDQFDPDIIVLVHVPERSITKDSVKGLDYSSIGKDVEKAFALAERGEYLRALEANSRAYARVLDWDESVADSARKKGALAAGISGTGPATVALCERGEAGEIRKAMARHEGAVVTSHVSAMSAREVVPRLL